MAISSLSFEDTIRIIAHFHTFNPSKRIIDNSALKNRGYTDEMIAAISKQKETEFGKFESCGIRFNKPFSHLKYDYFFYVLKLYDNYQRGILPFSGGLADQPNQIIEIFSLLNALHNEKRKQDEKK